MTEEHVFNEMFLFLTQRNESMHSTPRRQRGWKFSCHKPGGYL